ncbi:alpha-amylase family glycosyl hydrolase [Companilactobacillus jidongensis]|uniref:alpha-amylase family glycosyl hydrolase n=1 Tax=Companilactobacillus jidongensis TaxID=2486006 RepID=UPI000F7A2609|nr:alpha-amylase family glycosyl hydrolase [Companilactobacillus jidongensis]
MKWYDNAIIYQIYPKSFQDSNDDGIGDLPGIIHRLDYIKQLGVNTIWLNPIFVSPQIDNGYDVSNYFAIDPSLGTIDDFERLMAEAHSRNLHVILDLPINHTSDQHPWFTDAINNKNSIFKDYYIWGKQVDGHEPNNWGSFFGGSVWSKINPDSEYYYFHLFDKKMPDLNWKNVEVQKSMADIAKFWIEKGVDGFRLDAFIHMAKANLKQMALDNSEKYPVDDTFFANLPEVKKYLGGFVSQLKEENPDIFLLGEAASANAYQAAEYTQPDEDGCDMIVSSDNFGEVYDDKNFGDIPKFFRPRQISLDRFKNTFVKWESVLANTSFPALTWGNHDISRFVDRLKLPTDDVKLKKSLAMMMFLQRGIPIIYYGEEIGQHGLRYEKLSDFDDQRALDLIQNLRSKKVPDEQILELLNDQDEMTARGPFQWDNTEYAGFSHVKPWNWAGHSSENAYQELPNTDSILNFYQHLLRLKSNDCFTLGDYRLFATDADMFVFERTTNDKYGLVIINFSDKEKNYQLPVKMSLRTALSNQEIKIVNGQIHLDAWGCCALMNDGGID